MPRASLTDQEIQAFRVKAVEAATRLFARDGYEAVTMRALAQELGCSAMTPYRYFADKNALFAAVRTEAFRRFADDQQRAHASVPDPRSQLSALRDAYIAFALSNPDAYRIMFELKQEADGDPPGLAEQIARSFSYLHRAVDAAIQAGAMAGDSLTTAHLLWASVHGLVSLQLAGKLTLGRTLQDLAGAVLQESAGRPSAKQRRKP